MKKLLIIAVLAFFSNSTIAQIGINRSKRPLPGPAPVIKIPDPAIFKLANGTTLLVVEDHKLPKVSASLFIDFGPVKEGAKAGVTGLMGQMLSEGTKDLTKAQFDEAVDKLGADVSLNSAGGNVSALSRFFPQALELMGKAIKTPAFPKESFDKLKSQTITSMKADEKNVKSVSARMINALAYGKDHPSGEFQTEKTIQELTLSDVLAAYQKYITPSRAYLTIVGDITPAEAKRLTDKFFSDWKGAPLALPVLAAVPNPAKTEIDVVNMANAVQSEITVTNLVSLKMSDPDYFPLLLANQVLGGRPTGRLFMNLREKHGYTYDAVSTVGPSRFQSKFSATAAVRTAKTDSAVMQFLVEIERLRKEKVNAEELANAKALYNGSFALGMENTERIATFARNILVNDLPKDFYRTYLQKLNAVTADDVMRVAQKYFNYGNTRIVVVGNSAQMLDALKKLNYPVKEYDSYANAIVEGAKSAAVLNVRSSDVMSAYLNAIGGAAELQKVKSIDMTMALKAQGMSLDVKMKQMAPNMDMIAISMGGNVMMKNTFNGKTGYSMQGPSKKELTADEIAEKNLITGLFEEMDYLKNPAFKSEVKGIEKVNGSDAYKIVVTYPSGTAKTGFYDVASKFLLKREETDKAGNTTTVEFSDYRKVGSVYLPYTLTSTISAGGQSQVLEMKASDIKINEGVTAEDFK